MCQNFKVTPTDLQFSTGTMQLLEHCSFCFSLASANVARGLERTEFVLSTDCKRLFLLINVWIAFVLALKVERTNTRRINTQTMSQWSMYFYWRLLENESRILCGHGEMVVRQNVKCSSRFSLKWKRTGWDCYCRQAIDRPIEHPAFLKTRIRFGVWTLGMLQTFCGYCNGRAPIQVSFSTFWLWHVGTTRPSFLKTVN